MSTKITKYEEALIAFRDWDAVYDSRPHVWMPVMAPGKEGGISVFGPYGSYFTPEEAAKAVKFPAVRMSPFEAHKIVAERNSKKKEEVDKNKNG